MVNGDNNENGKKKTMGQWVKFAKAKRLVHAAYFFVHFFAVFLHS